MKGCSFSSKVAPVEQDIYDQLIDSLILAECFFEHHIAKSKQMTLEDLYNVKEISRTIGTGACFCGI